MEKLTEALTRVLLSLFAFFEVIRITPLAPREP